jgi:hypothetical protein
VPVGMQLAILDVKFSNWPEPNYFVLNHILQIMVVVLGPLTSPCVTLDPKMRGKGIAILT